MSSHYSRAQNICNKEGKYHGIIWIAMLYLYLVRCGFDVVASSSFRFQFSGFDSFESNEIVHQVSVFRHIIFCTRWKCIHAQILEFQNFFLHIVTTKSLVVKLFLHSIY